MAIPILWRTTKERYNLQGDKCPECARLVFPPRRLCPYCGCESDKPTAEEPSIEFAFVHNFMLPTNVEFSAAGDD
jgi:uncharacterized OB-fold protein